MVSTIVFPTINLVVIFVLPSKRDFWITTWKTKKKENMIVKFIFAPPGGLSPNHTCGANTRVGNAVDNVKRSNVNRFFVFHSFVTNLIAVILFFIENLVRSVRVVLFVYVNILYQRLCCINTGIPIVILPRYLPLFNWVKYLKLLTAGPLGTAIKLHVIMVRKHGPCGYPNNDTGYTPKIIMRVFGFRRFQVVEISEIKEHVFKIVISITQQLLRIGENNVFYYVFTFFLTPCNKNNRF